MNDILACNSEHDLCWNLLRITKTLYIAGWRAIAAFNATHKDKLRHAMQLYVSR